MGTIITIQMDIVIDWVIEKLAQKLNHKIMDHDKMRKLISKNLLQKINDSLKSINSSINFKNADTTGLFDAIMCGALYIYDSKIIGEGSTFEGIGVTNFSKNESIIIISTYEFDFNHSSLSSINSNPNNNINTTLKDYVVIQKNSKTPPAPQHGRASSGSMFFRRSLSYKRTRGESQPPPSTSSFEDNESSFTLAGATTILSRNTSNTIINVNRTPSSPYINNSINNSFNNNNNNNGIQRLNTKKKSNIDDEYTNTHLKKCIESLGLTLPKDVNTDSLVNIIVECVKYEPRDDMIEYGLSIIKESYNNDKNNINIILEKEGLSKYEITRAWDLYGNNQYLNVGILDEKIDINIETNKNDNNIKVRNRGRSMSVDETMEAMDKYTKQRSQYIKGRKRAKSTSPIHLQESKTDITNDINTRSASNSINITPHLVGLSPNLQMKSWSLGSTHNNSNDIDIISSETMDDININNNNKENRKFSIDKGTINGKKIGYGPMVLKHSVKLRKTKKNDNKSIDSMKNLLYKGFLEIKNKGKWGKYFFVFTLNGFLCRYKEPNSNRNIPIDQIRLIKGQYKVILKPWLSIGYKMDIIITPNNNGKSITKYVYIY